MSFSRSFITLLYNLIDNNTIDKANVLQIKNLRNKTESIHRDLFSLIYENHSQSSEQARAVIFKNISRLKDKVDQLSAKHQATPADLATPSFRIYLWLRFLSEEFAFQTHLKGLREFLDVLVHANKKDALSPDLFLLKADYSGYLYQRKTAGGKTLLLIHEGYISAPPDLKKTLVSAAYAKRRGKAAAAVKAFATSETYLRLNRQISGEPIANTLSCIGKYVNLADVYTEINAAYFSAALPQPRLIWSSVRAKRRLGYFHPDIQTIAVNKKLDSRKTPELLVRYILYHEMLHQYFGIEHRNGRRYAHTTAFHQAEKRFQGYQEAENLIKLL